MRNIKVNFRLSTAGTKTFAVQLVVGLGGLKDDSGKYLRLYINVGMSFSKSDWSEKRGLPHDSLAVNKLIKLEQATLQHIEGLTEAQVKLYAQNGILQDEIKKLIQIYIHSRPYKEVLPSLQNSNYIPSNDHWQYWRDRMLDFNLNLIDNKGRLVDLNKFFDKTFNRDDIEIMVVQQNDMRVELIDNYPIPFYEYCKIAGKLKMTKSIKNKLEDDREYIKVSNKFFEFDPNITLGKMTDNISMEFIEWVKENSNITRLNSLGSIIKTLRSILNYATKKDKYTFENSKPAILPNINTGDDDIYGKLQEEVAAVYLNEARLELLANYKSKNKQKEYVAHLFAINASGFGARYSDIDKLFDVQKVKDSKGNDVWAVSFKDNKTGKDGAVPISNKVYNLIQRYKVYEHVPASDFNRLIKEVCEDLGFDENVTHIYENLKPTGKNDKYISETKPFFAWVSSHCCRRSFCTNNWLKKTPNWVVMQFSKHQDEQVYLKYVKASQMEGMQVYIDTLNK